MCIRDRASVVACGVAGASLAPVKAAMSMVMEGTTLQLNYFPSKGVPAIYLVITAASLSVPTCISIAIIRLIPVTHRWPRMADTMEAVLRGLVSLSSVCFSVCLSVSLSLSLSFFLYSHKGSLLLCTCIYSYTCITLSEPVCGWTGCSLFQCCRNDGSNNCQCLDWRRRHCTVCTCARVWHVLGQSHHWDVLLQSWLLPNRNISMFATMYLMTL